VTDELARGAVVIVSVPGDFGKPRPAVVVQSDRLTSIMESVVIALVTSSVRGGRHVRVQVEPTELNGLRVTSRIMVDKLFTLQKHRVSQVVGQVDGATMLRVDEALRTILDLEPQLDLNDS
jgi:mRNA interferase MazF